MRRQTTRDRAQSQPISLGDFALIYRRALDVIHG